MKLLLSVLVLLLFVGCSDQSKKDTKQASEVQKKVEVKKVAPKPKKVEVKKIVKKEEPKIQKVQKKVQKVVAKVKETTKEIANVATSVTSNPKVKKIAEKVTKSLDAISSDKVSSKAGTTIKSAPTGDIKKAAAGLLAGFGGAAAVTPKKKSSIDGGALFKSNCSSCHGAKAQNKALGKSHVIAGWDSKKISAALHGYKNGTYGGSMKTIMKGQASKLNDDQISALANFISKL